MSCETLFARRLKERGYRMTPQRQAILSALHDAAVLLTAEEIRAKVLPVVPSADLSTVYRTLDLLEELGLVSSAHMESGEHRYALVGAHGPHIHLLCRSCGAVSTADLSAASELAAALAREHGFLVDAEGLSVPGLCAACQARAHASR